MDSILSLGFWTYGLIFFLAIAFVWLFPGLLVLRVLKLKTESIAQLALGLVLGICFWGIQAYLLGILNLRVLTFAYLAIALAASFINRKYLWSQMRNAVVDLGALPKPILGLIVVGVLVQVAQMIGSGLVSSYGMAFFRVHMQDGLYHLSMIQSMVRSFPPIEPGASGILVKNYHYWSDLVLADLVRVFGIPANYLFFQYIPPVLSIFTALASLSILQLWTKNKMVWFFGLFFLFFGADLGYLVGLLLHGQISFQYPVIDNGATQFLNMPHVFAKLIFTTSLVSLWHWLEEFKLKWGLITILSTALLFGFKVYFGLFAVLGLATVVIITLIKLLIIRHKNEVGRNLRLILQLIICGAIGGLLALAIYLPPNRGSGGLEFYPLEWPKLMLAEANLDWRQWRYKHAVAELEGRTAKIIFYDLQAILITLIAIHGTRMLGIFITKKTGRELGSVWIAYLLVPSIIFTILGLYTLQVSGGFNVFNFFATSLVALSFLSAFLFADLWQIKRVGPILVVVLLALTVPRIIFETQKILVSYRDKTDVLYVSKSEISALSSIDKTYPKNCVIVSSFNNETDMNTPYVSYFANRFSYMSGQRVLETHNAPTLERYKEFKEIFAGNEPGKIESVLRAKGICALYLKKDDELGKFFETHVKLSFENEESRVVDLR